MSLLFFPIAWMVTAAGRTLLVWLRLATSATPLERNLGGYALGLGVLAYGMLVLGLLGLLYPFAGLLWVLALGALGGRQHIRMSQEAALWVRGGIRLSPVGWGMALLFSVFALIALVGVYCPPIVFLNVNHTGKILYTEWDSLSYHLADPKIYLQAHRIMPLPWQPHSNFAFTTEMWYVLALMARGSVPLAKWFHFSCAVGSGLAVYALAARHLTAKVGIWGALLFAATPLVYWEAGTAYIDLATAFFATVALLAVTNGLASRDESWLRLGAVFIGFAVSTKATGFASFVLFAVGLMYWRLRILRQGWGSAIGAVLVWCALALIVGSPWYLKSLVYTGNPVYPYFYHVFGGRYWSEASAAAYAASNNPGLGHDPASALLLPWNLTLYPVPGHPTPPGMTPFNEFPSVLVTLMPISLAALFFPVWRRDTTPGIVKALGIYALAWMLLWFAQTQFVRFLLPILPVLCLLTAWVLSETLAARLLSGYALSGLAVASLAWSGWAGVQLISAQAPVALGQESREQYITDGFAGYQAMQFANTHLPPGSKIVFYGERFGFYCDKPYLWGEYGTYIPSERFHSSEDLRRYLRGIGVTHILVDPRYYTLEPGNSQSGWVYDLTAGSKPPLFSEHGVSIWELPPD